MSSVAQHFMENATTKRIKTAATVFELPRKLGVLQHVEYEPSLGERCADGNCLYEGVLTAEGCRRDACIKYRMRVRSRGRKRWG
jgi:hypothetical protein